MKNTAAIYTPFEFYPPPKITKLTLERFPKEIDSQNWKFVAENALEIANKALALELSRLERALSTVDVLYKMPQ